VRAILLLNGNLLAPAGAIGPWPGTALVEINPFHPDYRKWRPYAKAGEDPRPGQVK
jgi:hypothetical protein